MFYDAGTGSSGVLRLARQSVLHMVCEINVVELPAAFGRSREAPQDHMHIEINYACHRGKYYFGVATNHGADAITITLHYSCSPKVRAGGNARYHQRYYQ